MTGASTVTAPAVLRSVTSRERLTGTIVHRLMQRRFDRALDASTLTSLVPSLLRTTETVDVDDLDALAADAVALYMRLRGQDDLTRLLASGRCEYEVPFSFEPPDRPGDLVRGVIDCLVRTPTAGATVIEFKTGAPRPEHATQAGIYARALAAALDVAEVDVRVVYAERADGDRARRVNRRVAVCQTTK